MFFYITAEAFAFLHSMEHARNDINEFINEMPSALNASEPLEMFVNKHEMNPTGEYVRKSEAFLSECNADLF